MRHYKTICNVTLAYNICIHIHNKLRISFPIYDQFVHLLYIYMYFLSAYSPDLYLYYNSLNLYIDIHVYIFLVYTVFPSPFCAFAILVTVIIFISLYLTYLVHILPPSSILWSVQKAAMIAILGSVSDVSGRSSGRKCQKSRLIDSTPFSFTYRNNTLSYYLVSHIVVQSSNIINKKQKKRIHLHHFK